MDSRPSVIDPEPSATRSLVLRAGIALVLTVGFYALALAIAFGLLWVPYAEWRYAERVHGRLALFCVVGAFLILRAILPRRDSFVPPGPRLAAGQHPRLFAELRAIAAGASQEMPSEVYLVPDVNAWVSQRGGVMGLGGSRIMGLGLPLLQAVRVSELRAIVAHEFGHYFGGDVRLGPLIYRTREALVRTVIALHQHSGLLTKPFEWYAALFFRVSHAVSRHQELQADALAARIAGPDALARGLRAVHGAGLAFEPYWAQEVVPVLGAGYVPPLAGGFSRFLDQPNVNEVVRKAIETEEREGKADPYDTHPSLRERLKALSALAGEAPPRQADDPPAITLVGALAQLEMQLLVHHAADREKVGRLKPLGWDDVGGAVYVPQWEGFLRERGSVLAGVTPASLDALDWKALGTTLVREARKGDQGGDPQDPLPMAEFAVGCGLGLALVRRGYTVEAPPGAPVTLVREGRRFEPFGVRGRIVEDAERWRALVAEAGIGDVDLSRPRDGGQAPE